MNSLLKRRKLLLLASILAAGVGCAGGSRQHTEPVFRTVSATNGRLPGSNIAAAEPTSTGNPLAVVATAYLLPAVQTEGKADSERDTIAQTEAEPTATSNAPEKVSSRADVNHFVSLALSAHPKIIAARQRVQAAANVPIQARSLPDPMFSNTFWPIHDAALQTAGGRAGNQMNLTQQIPWPDKLEAKAQIATHEYRMAQAEVEAVEREIIEAVRLAYYDLWFADRARQVTEQTRGLILDLEQVAEARFRTGGSQQDVLRAQLERDRLDDQLVALRKQKEMAHADLATLLQQPLDVLPDPVEELNDLAAAERLETFIAQAERCNPTLRGLAAEIARDRSRERLACLQQYPDLTLGTHWGIISDRDAISPVADGNDNFSFTVGTSLPIWRDKIAAGVREAAHRRTSTMQRYQAERDLLYGKLRRLMAQVDAVAEQREIYNERIVPRTEDTLKLTVADYRGKRTDFFTVVETYRELLMLELQLARFDATLAGLFAQIDRTVGCSVAPSTDESVRY